MLMRFAVLFIFLIIGYNLGSSKIKTDAFLTMVKSSGLEEDETESRLNQQAAEAAKFTRNNGYNRDFCFLVDMRIPSGKNRFFIYDLKKNTITDKGLVAHGSGLYQTAEINFSNEPGSYCSSTGKYKIGNPYQGKFGLAYKLYGLDSTNNNAYERFVVLHSHSCVPEEELPEYTICQSLGCPTVSPKFLARLQEKIDGSKKPVLMWIYY